MGLENRDYIRHDSSGHGGWRSRDRSRDIVQTLIIINIVVYIFQFFTIPGPLGRYSPVEEWFQLDPEGVLWGQIWRLTTYDFLHARGDLFHILINMYVFWMTGRRLQYLYGWKEFLTFFLMAGAFAGLGYVAWALMMRQPYPCIGASGAVAATMVLYAFHWPREVWYIMGVLPMPVAWIAVLYAIFDIHPMLLEFSGAGRGGNVAHSAHVAGMLFAVLYFQQQWRLLDWFGQFAFFDPRRWLKRKPNLRVRHPDPGESSTGSPLSAREQARMDQLLQKIQDDGQDSLTAEEQQFLADASRKIRERRG